MPTKPLPANTHNVTVNMPTCDAINLVRSAGRMGMSMGAYARRCFRLAKFVWASARIAAKAKDADLQALEILERVLADGTVSAAELPALRDALALVRKSADLDAIAASTADKAINEGGAS